MNEICDEGAKAIFESLKFNTTLAELDMSILLFFFIQLETSTTNNISAFNNYGKESVKCICDALIKNAHLSKLKINSNLK